MTELVEPVSSGGEGSPPDATVESVGESTRDRGGDSPAESVADRLRARGERVRRRELDTALRKLESHGDLPPEQRRIVERLSTRLTDALVERWVAALADADDADPEVALELLTD